MLDTQGPEIRTGQFPNGEEAEVKLGDKVVVTVDDAHRLNQSKDRLWISYKDFPRSTHVGASVLIEDGIMELRVTKILSDTDVQCEVLNNGSFGNKKGVNLPGQVITLPAISDKDKADLL
jgi:pyruvate kinase